MGNRINTIMQAAFFKLAEVIPYEQADEYMKAYAKKTYGKKGDARSSRRTGTPSTSPSPAWSRSRCLRSGPMPPPAPSP